MTLALSALGCLLHLEVEDARLLDLAERAFDDLRARASDGCGGLLVRVDGRAPWTVSSPRHDATADTLDAALGGLLTAVNLTAVAHTPLLALHAAVVAREHEVLVLPGASGLGKSTLTACLLGRGWSYVSDEALALHWQTGELVAYPRPLALDPWSCRVVGNPPGLACPGETALTAAQLGAPVLLHPGAPTRVVLLTREADQKVRAEEVDRNEGLAELLQRGFTHHQDGGRALVLISDLLRSAQVLRLHLGDPRAAADLLTRAVP